MKFLRMPFFLSLLCLSCISMMETAKVNKGVKYNVSIGLSGLNPENSEWKIENQIKRTVGFDIKISKGKLFGESKSFGIELGANIGFIFYPTVVGVTDYSSELDKYELFYYPSSLNTLLTPRIFAKFGFLQNRDLSIAAKIEMGGEKFVSSSLIISKKAEKKEIYSGVKVFNRFIKDPEKQMFPEKLGQYFFTGTEIPTNLRFFNSFKYFYVNLEAGIVNNIWYADKPTYLLSIGLTVR